jgi:hypothetical protein
MSGKPAVLFTTTSREHCVSLHVVSARTGKALPGYPIEVACGYVRASVTKSGVEDHQGCGRSGGYRRGWRGTSAGEAGKRGGCRGETPRTPPAAGEVARALGRTSHMRSVAHALGRACARSHVRSVARALGRT